MESQLGHRFRDRNLLRQALTHRSLVEENSRGATPEPAGQSNELLEFLGDAVLGLLVSEELIRHSPQAQEGELSKRRARLVNKAHLHRVAQKLGLGGFLRLGRGEERSGGRAKKALLADAMEAVVAAIYLDGGIDPARLFIRRWVLESIDGDDLHATDYKSELQEALQERKLAAPRYVVVKERGPEHRKIFTVQAVIAGQAAAEAEGESKKAAQQAAARIALERLREGEIGAGDARAGNAESR